MAQGKATEYYLTEKGQGFNIVDPKYIAEEREIIEALRSSRLSVKGIVDNVNKELKTSRTWYFIVSRIKALEKEGFLSVYRHN